MKNPTTKLLLIASVVAVACAFTAPAVQAAAPAPEKTDTSAPAPQKAKKQRPLPSAEYRDLAKAALDAFKAGDYKTADAKGRELEKAYDTKEKDLKKSDPTSWTPADKAMDVFMKPFQKTPYPTVDVIQKAYDDYITKLGIFDAGKRAMTKAAKAKAAAPKTDAPKAATP